MGDNAPLGTGSGGEQPKREPVEPPPQLPAGSSTADAAAGTGCGAAKTAGVRARAAGACLGEAGCACRYSMIARIAARSCTRMAAAKSPPYGSDEAPSPEVAAAEAAAAPPSADDDGATSGAAVGELGVERLALRCSMIARIAGRSCALMAAARSPP